MSVTKVCRLWRILHNRHFYASALIRAGLNVKIVQARLGHATAMETLTTYAHLWPDDADLGRGACHLPAGSQDQS